MKSWVEIDEPRLGGNLVELQRVIAEVGLDQPTALLAVVKANAYGHGIEYCAVALAKSGAPWLGVTDAREGAVVRAALVSAGIPLDQQPEVLVMCGTVALEGETERIVEHRLTAVVWETTQIERLAESARRYAATVAVHIEIDTGMARQGVTPGEGLARVLDAVRRRPELRLGGVFTHLASAEVTDSPQTIDQQRRFGEAITQVAAGGAQPDWVHIGNSSFIDGRAGEMAAKLQWLHGLARLAGAKAMVRAGLALYGYLLPVEGGSSTLPGAELQPVMTWMSRIVDLREVETGALVGYNGVFIAQRPMRVALLPVGYADGLRRELSGSNERPGGWVMIGGHRAAIVGRISMNLTTVDVSGIDGVRVGDQVVLLGDGITADDHAKVAGTIPYEILCGVKAG